jgi:fanconi-associated nuclease 1
MKRLETLLKLDREDRRKCLYKQKKHVTTTIEGERIWEMPEKLQKPRKPSRAILKDTLNLPQGLCSNAALDPATPKLVKQERSFEVDLAWRKGKSVWRGKNNEEVTVEGFSLQHYEMKGYKGYIPIGLAVSGA